jgi:hypothetical protein
MEHMGDPWYIALIVVLLLMLALSAYAIVTEFLKWLRS